MAPPTRTFGLREALQVLILSPETRAYLAAHDPKALQQAELALANDEAASFPAAPSAPGDLLDAMLPPIDVLRGEREDPRWALVPGHMCVECGRPCSCPDYTPSHGCMTCGRPDCGEKGR